MAIRPTNPQVPLTYAAFEACYNKASAALLGRGTASQFGFETIKEGQYLGRDDAPQYGNSPNLPFTPRPR